MLQLSIIIVSYNTCQILDNCLASVCACIDRLRTEIIVVDNASSDDSVHMVRGRYPHVHLIINEANRGFAAANNQAITVARGKYILLLNSDTIVLDDVLASCIRYMDEHPDVGAMGCRVLNRDRTLQLTCSQEPTFLNLLLLTTGLWRLNRPRWFGRYQMKHWDRADERDVEVISGCYLLVRREVVDEVGLLDENFFFFGEETDWCKRMRKAGWKLRLAPVGEIIHYGSASALSLGHERDLLLTNGLIRYHLKHSGMLTAVAVWMLLLCFNISRCVYWTIRSLCTSDPDTHKRRQHFSDIIRAYMKTWPTQTSIRT